MEGWLHTFNNKIRKQNRKVLLFLDNATSHPHFNLSNILIAWLPPNTISVTQPMCECYYFGNSLNN